MDNGIPLSSSNYAMTSKRKKNRCSTFKIQMKNIVYLLDQRMMYCLRIGKKTCLCTEAIKDYAASCSGKNFSPAT